MNCIQVLYCTLLPALAISLPLVMNTWAFVDANKAAWETITNLKANYLEAVVAGCSICESQQCDGTVGYGGSPDEDGHTTLDAFIMDGATMNVGAVAGLIDIKPAISVAYHVLLYTRHSILVGESASEFAEMMGFQRESLQTQESKAKWKSWKQNQCQPNFWMQVTPDASISCGPYFPENNASNLMNANTRNLVKFDQYNHDTIGMIVIDKDGNIATGTSTNGASHKIPGRVGDSPIPGSGAYADNSVGAAAATGDGDIMLRFLPSFIAVERLRLGDSVDRAARYSMLRIKKYYPKFMGAIIVASKDGDYSAACHGMEKFPYSVYKNCSNEPTIIHVECIHYIGIHNSEF